jgi:hypothetical protein
MASTAAIKRTSGRSRAQRDMHLLNAGTIMPPNTATTTYNFGIRSDDASSLYIDGVKIVNDSGASPYLAV